MNISQQTKLRIETICDTIIFVLTREQWIIRPLVRMELNVSTLIQILKLIAILVAAIMIGNWFLAEVREGRLKGKPWYHAYFSTPGILILIALLILPLIIWIRKK